jgi:iron complex transport system ATP-binding protein
MKVLVEHGYAVSAGVVNVLDSDYENAKDLRVPVVAEVPFSQIGEEAHSDNLKLVDESVAVVLSPFPVGPGNFRNLEAARYALDGGKKILVLKPEKCPDIDFVGGRADAFIKNLITSGAVRVLGAEELVSQIPKAGS